MTKSTSACGVHWVGLELPSKWTPGPGGGLVRGTQEAADGQAAGGEGKQEPGVGLERWVCGAVIGRSGGSGSLEGEGLQGRAQCPGDWGEFHALLPS